MIRLIFLSILFLLSLLIVFRAPTNLLWYVSILVTELSWVFLLIVLVTLIIPIRADHYYKISFVTGIVSIIIFSLPVLGALKISEQLKAGFTFQSTHITNYSPFSFAKLITGNYAKQIDYKTLTYDSANALTLDFYPAVTPGIHPCIIVVHGGSWAGGNSQQLPELNSELAKAGYHVATINYRLAPAFKFPLPLEDLKCALKYLQANASTLSLDPNNFVLLGRSAGGQIVLSAAYTLHEPSIKGVISYYGPADMVWGYAHPTNKLVLNSRKIMEDYLGGTISQVHEQYIKSSATETVGQQTVPTLLIAGKNDPLVSWIHAEKLAVKLDSAGVKHYELYLPWATHAFDWTLNGPSGQLSTWSVFRFLEFLFPLQKRNNN